MDEHFKSEPFRLSSDPFAMPTDDKLKADAASLVDQYIHYWNEGEVECMVIISRPGSPRPIYAYTQMDKQRARHILRLCEANLLIEDQKTMISKGEKR